MSLTIDVDLSPVFRSACPLSRFSVVLGELEPTVKHLLRRLCQEWGENMASLVFDGNGDSILPGLMVMVNDQTFTGNDLNHRDIPLHGGDKVSLLFFVSGG